MKPKQLKLIYRPVFRWAAKRTLSNTRVCSAGDLDRILNRHWRLYDELTAIPAKASTFGGRMNLGLACATLSFFQSLEAEEFSRHQAIDLTARAAWNIYKKWGLIPKVISGLVRKNPVERLRFCVRMFLRFPFNKPFYRFEHYPIQSGIALDMYYCPITQFFRSHGMADLCMASWCNLDFPLARMWGGTLRRSQTLADGADCCDFEFIVPSTGAYY